MNCVNKHKGANKNSGTKRKTAVQNGTFIARESQIREFFAKADFLSLFPLTKYKYRMETNLDLQIEFNLYFFLY